MIYIPGNVGSFIKHVWRNRHKRRSKRNVEKIDKSNFLLNSGLMSGLFKLNLVTYISRKVFLLGKDVLVGVQLFS